MGDARLVRLAPEAIVVNCVRQRHGYWNLLLRVRRGGELWDEGYRADYAGLTTDELVDVIEAELRRELA